MIPVYQDYSYKVFHGFLKNYHSYKPFHNIYIYTYPYSIYVNYKISLILYLSFFFAEPSGVEPLPMDFQSIVRQPPIRQLRGDIHLIPAIRSSRRPAVHTHSSDPGECVQDRVSIGQALYWVRDLNP